MKKNLVKSLVALNLVIWSVVGYQVAHAQDKGQPVYGKTTPNPVVAPSNEKQKVCIKDDKTGKETCKMMKIHKKLEGTPVPKK